MCSAYAYIRNLDSDVNSDWRKSVLCLNASFGLKIIAKIALDIIFCKLVFCGPYLSESFFFIELEGISGL